MGTWKRLCRFFLCCCLASESCLTLFPMDCSPPVHPWDFPGRILVDWHFSFLQGNLPDPSIELMFLALQADSSVLSSLGKRCFLMYFFLKTEVQATREILIPHLPLHSYPSPIFQKESIPLMCPCMLPWAIKTSEGSRWRHRLLVWRYSPFCQREHVRSLLQGLPPDGPRAKTPHSHAGGLASCSGS